jgi:hypothetical protein
MILSLTQNLKSTEYLKNVLTQVGWLLPGVDDSKLCKIRQEILNLALVAARP